jgi:hypothetical protein
VVRERLRQPGAWIAIRPQTLRALDSTTLVCKVQVRSQTPVEPMLLAEALVEAVGRAKERADGSEPRAEREHSAA